MPQSPWTAADLFPPTLPGDGEPALAAVRARPHLVWSRAGMLYHAYLTEAGWTTPGPLARGRAPVLAAGAGGLLHCVFQNEFAGNTEVYYAMWNGVCWTLPVNVSHTSGVSGRPALAQGPDGALYVAWADTTSGDSVIYYAKQEGDFWTSQPVHSGRGAQPALAVTPHGDLYIAWQDVCADTGNQAVFCAIRTADQWRVPEVVSDSPHAHALAPVIAATGRGTCHIVWQEEAEGGRQICYSDRRPNGWAAPQVISAAGQEVHAPRLAVNTLNYLELAWLEGAALRHSVRPPDYDAAWRTAETVATNCAALSDLSLATNHNGKVHLAWSAGPVTAGRLYYTEREPLFKHSVVMPIVTK